MRGNGQAGPIVIQRQFRTRRRYEHRPKRLVPGRYMMTREERKAGECTRAKIVHVLACKRVKAPLDEHRGFRVTYLNEGSAEPMIVSTEGVLTNTIFELIERDSGDSKAA